MDRLIFSKQLKETTELLEKNGILYDVIFDYRNKSSFENIKFLVNSTVDSRQLSSMFGSIEKMDSKFITINRDDTKLVFIKSDEHCWTNNFYYYSGEIISDAINAMAKPLDLIYNDKGLYHKGIKNPILLTNKVFDIFNFFEIGNSTKGKSIVTGFDTLVDIFEIIINSTYFNSNAFSISDISHDDYFYAEKIKNYSLFLKAIEPFKSVPNMNYSYDSKEYYLELVDEYFKESKFLMHYFKQASII